MMTHPEYMGWSVESADAIRIGDPVQMHVKRGEEMETVSLPLGYLDAEMRIAYALELFARGEVLPKSSPDWSCGIEVGQKIHALMVERGFNPPDLCEYDRTWPWGGTRKKPGTPECSRLGPNRMR